MPQPTGNHIVDRVRPNEEPSVSPQVEETLESQAAMGSPAATSTAISHYPSHFHQPPQTLYAQLDEGP